MHEDWRDVLDFWFGAPDSPQHGETRAEWFRKSDAFDAAIRTRFAATYEAAARGDLAHWRAQPLSALALVIVLDQFPRNIHRAQPAAFAYDARALELTRRGPTWELTS